MVYPPAFRSRRSPLADAGLPDDAEPAADSITEVADSDAPILPPSIGVSGPSIPLTSPKLLAVQFQGPSSTSSPNHIALAGSIAGVVVIFLAFVLWEFHRIRRRRRKFAQSDAEAAQALPVYSRREEKSEFGYANLPSTTHLPPPPPAYYSASYVPRA